MSTISVVGIDPGYMNFAYYVGEYVPHTRELLDKKWKNKHMIATKQQYTLKRMKARYTHNKLIFSNENTIVVIEKQIRLRFINIVNYLCELMPNAIVLDTCPLKKAFKISTGRHYTNKVAAWLRCSVSSRSA